MTHPSHNPAARGAVEQDVMNTILESISSGETAELPHSAARARALWSKCDGGMFREYWGTDFDGNRWRVRLVGGEESSS